jgi:hypothetical protein
MDFGAFTTLQMLNVAADNTRDDASVRSAFVLKIFAESKARRVRPKGRNIDCANLFAFLGYTNSKCNKTLAQFKLLCIVQFISQNGEGLQ